MIRFSVVAIVLSCLASSLPVQAQPAPKIAVAPVTKRIAATNTDAGRTLPAENFSCGLGVIVAVGDEFEVQKVGLFNDDHAEVPIDNWGLRDLIFARVRAAAPPGTVVQRIAYYREKLPPEPKGVLFRDIRAEISQVTRQITSGTHCRRYLTVGRSISPFYNSVHHVGGVGIVDWSNPLRHQTYLFALSFVRVFNGADFTIIRQHSAFIEREPLLKHMLIGSLILGPHRELDVASFPATPADAASNPVLRDGVRAMLTASLDKILPAMLRP